MSDAREQLWGRLHAAALVEGELPAEDAVESPWFVRVMLGVAGWIGAIFLFGFVAVAFQFIIRNETASMLTGMLACAGAAVLFWSAPRNNFITQFGFAVSLAGQGLVLYGLSDATRDEAATALGMAIVEVILFFAIPSFVHRVWSAATAALAMGFAMMEWGTFSLMPALLTVAAAALWLEEFDRAREGPLLRAGGYGLTLALVLIITFHAGGEDWGWRWGSEPLFSPWVGAGLSGAVLMGIVVIQLRRNAVALDGAIARVALAAALVLAIATLKAPGLAPAVVILGLGFSNGNAVLAGLGSLGLIGYLGQYYYSLQITLLEKSMIMIAAGIALLLVRQLLQVYWPRAASGAGDNA